MRIVNFAAVLVTTLGFASGVHAVDENLAEKYRNYTLEQIGALSEGKYRELRRQLPVMYLSAADMAFMPSDAAALVFGMKLNMLMYPGIHDFEAAVKLFQKDIGDEPTGILTLWQVYNLERMSDLVTISGAIIFNARFYSLKLDGRAWLRGTVTLIDEADGERIAFPVNHVNVECIKSIGSCREDRINVQIPNTEKEHWSPYYSIFMDLDSDYWKITRWEEDEIEAVSASPSPRACRTTSFILNFKTEEFYQITRNNGRDCKIPGTDVTLPPLKKPRVAQIIDGGKIVKEEVGKVWQAATGFFSSDFRKRIQELEQKYMDE